MDKGILLLVGLGGLVIGAAAATTKLPDGLNAGIGEAAVAIRAKLGDVFTPDEARAAAAWFWDTFVKSSEYYTREQWVALVLRAVFGGLTMESRIAPSNAAAWKSSPASGGASKGKQ
ncbi:MAG: hypothetical protein ACK2U9_10605 [Anaerolineae bacterium]